MKIGDIIKAKINHSQGSYHAGEEFVLEGVHPCEKCGMEWIDIGIPQGEFTYARCTCGRMVLFNGHRLFWKSNFDKAEAEDSYMKKLIKKAFKTYIL